MNERLHPFSSKVIRSIVLACLGGVLPTASVGQTIVWTDQDARRIQGKEVRGGEVGTIVQFASSPAATQIHYDPITAKLYYRRGTAFQRINLDGSAPEIIPTPSAGGFTLNVDSRKLYWVYSGSIYRSELDGTGVHSHAYPTCCLGSLEAFGDDLFFGAAGMMSKGVWRADADGSNEQFVHGTPQPFELAYDPVENKLYIATIEGIFRMNLDGTEFQLVLQLDPWPEQLVIDYRARKLYWTDPNTKIIQRSNLDGSNVVDFVTAADAGNPNLALVGLEIVYTSTPIPTLSGWGVIVMGSILLAAGIFVMRKRRLTECGGTTDGQHGSFVGLGSISGDTRNLGVRIAGL